MACLDTCALLDLTGRGGRRLQSRVQKKLDELDRDEASFVTTRFNVAELWIGVARSRQPGAEQEVLATLLAPLGILEFGPDEAVAFGRLVGHLQDHGEPIGDMDALIAAVALVHGQSIVTRNAAHFERVPGLEVVSY